MMRSITVRLTGILFAFALVSPVSPCMAQQRPPQPPGNNVDDVFRRPVFLPPDRQTLRMLATAQALSDQGRYSQAVRLLQKILGETTDGERNEDSFISSDGNKRVEGDGSQSLKRAAQRLLGSLPQAARDSYELQYGGRASQLLDRAVAGGNIDAVAEVQRRFFHTRAGYRAMLLLAYDHLMHGKPHRAALCFEAVARSPVADQYDPELSLLYATALYRAGNKDAAEGILAALADARNGVAWKIGDTEVSLPRDKTAWAVWLERWVENVVPAPMEEDWVMFRGNATRTRRSSPSRPLMLRPLWQQRVATDAQHEEIIANLATSHLDQSIAAIPAMQPLAVGDLVLMRTPERVVAVHFETGKIIWQIETRATAVGFSSIDARARRIRAMNGGLGAVILPGRPSHGTPRSMTANLLNEQIWLDKTLGSMSSDGERLFLLEEFNNSNELRYIDQRGRKRIGLGYQYNVLRARSIAAAQGKLLWSLGGPHDPDPEMQRAFFLGPPLPLDGMLYQIAEIEDEVCLLVLDAATGEKIWRQQLAVVGQSSEFERRRRIGGISPSYANGVLVCPTGVGAMVGVDLTSRHLRWGYTYGEDQSGNGMRRNPAWQNQMLAAAPRLEQIWADACAIIAGDKVLITPTESDQLHCVSLAEGKPLWQRKRGKDVYLACIHDRKAFLVGPAGMTALSLDTGKEIGNEMLFVGDVDQFPLLATGAVPSGRGYSAEGRYYLPVRLPSGGAVLTVNLDTLEIEDVTAMRGEQAPGNLICHRDCVLSQNSDRLQCFYQHRSIEAQIAAALEENSADPEALLRQGEILFDRGDAVDAVELFRRSTAAFSRQAERSLNQGDAAKYGEAFATAVYARGLLREGLLEGLKDDFVANVETIPEIESLIDSPIDRVEFLRVLAAGQQRAEKWDLALEAYIKLLNIAEEEDPLLPLEMGWSARLSHLVRSSLDSLQSKLSPIGREKWQAYIASREAALQSVKSVESENDFQDFFFFFSADPAVERVRRRWVTATAADVPSLRVMQGLKEMREAGGDELARWATAEAAYRYDQLGLYKEAAECAQALQSRWPEGVCWNNKTALQVVEGLSPESRRAQMPSAWPTGKTLVKKQKKNQKIKSGYQLPLPVRFFPASASSQQAPQLWVEQRPQMRVFELDQYGRERWSVSLARVGASNPRSSPFYPSLNCARIEGDLLVLAVGGEVLAIDMLRARQAAIGRQRRTAADAESPILWRVDVLPTDPALRNEWSHALRRARTKPRWSDGTPNQSQVMNQISRLGPITEGGVTFMRNRELVSVDPITGKENWVQKGMHPLSEIFGDAEHVVVLPPKSNEVEVFSPIDGRREGTRIVPDAEQRWTTAGAQLLCWRKITDPQRDALGWELALYDPWTETDLWVHSVSPTAKASLVDQQAVAVFEPKNGNFVVIDRGTGEIQVKHQLASDVNVRGIYVVASDDSYFLVTNQGAPYNKDRTKYQAMPQGLGNIFFSGQILAIDRHTGDLRWSRPVDVEQWGLSLTQPRGLPLLILARRVTRRPPGNRSISFVEMALLDKRTGREIVPKVKLPHREYYYLVQGNKETETVDILFKNPASNFAIQFTEVPRAEDATSGPAELVHQKQSWVESTARSVLDSLEEAKQVAKEMAREVAREKAKRDREQQLKQKAKQAKGPALPHLKQQNNENETKDAQDE